MALSSCSAIGHNNVQSKGNFFKEEADACVELFGGNEDAIEFKRMTPLRSVAGDMVEPKVGVQYRAQYQNPGDAAWYIAVRFVAEIKTLDVNVTWTRSVYQADGTRLGTETSTATTKAYTSLNSNSTDIYPSSGYNYFVAYTLKDIPVTTFNDHMIVAYVTLSDTTGSLPAVNSKAMAAQIGGDVQTSFAANTTGYFLAGKIDGVENSVLAPELSTPSGNVARFSSHLTAEDSFYVCHRTASTFKVYNSSCLALDNPYLQDDGESSKKIEVQSSHNYAFNINNEFELRDIESGYTVEYKDKDNIDQTSPLIYAGLSGEKHQYFANISPKSNAALVFKLDGTNLTVYKDGDANIIADGLKIDVGANLGIYLKDNNNGTYNIWAPYPSISVSIDGSVSPVSGRADPGSGNLAAYDLALTQGQKVVISFGFDELKLGDTADTEYTAARAANYIFYVGSDRKVYVVELKEINVIDSTDWSLYGTKTYVWAWGAGMSSTWYSVDFTDQSGTLVVDYRVTTVKLVRLSPSSSEPTVGSNTYGEGYDLWGQIDNLDISGKSTITISGSYTGTAS